MDSMRESFTHVVAGCNRMAIRIPASQDDIIDVGGCNPCKESYWSSRWGIFLADGIRSVWILDLSPQAADGHQPSTLQYSTCLRGDFWWEGVVERALLLLPARRPQCDS